MQIFCLPVDFGQFAEGGAGLADGAFAAHEVDDIAVAPLGLLGVAFGFGGGLPGGFSGVEGGGAGGGCSATVNCSASEGRQDTWAQDSYSKK